MASPAAINVRLIVEGLLQRPDPQFSISVTKRREGLRIPGSNAIYYMETMETIGRRIFRRRQLMIALLLLVSVPHSLRIYLDSPMQEI